MALVRVHQLDHVALAVTDMERSTRWYEDVLGLTRRYADAWADYPVVLCAGEACIALFPAGGDEQLHTGGVRHVGFRTDRAAFEAARAEFERHGIASRFADHGICHSLYIND